MKLRNKKTGEMADLTLSHNGETLLLVQDGETLAYDVDLEYLVNNWEDYEEWKEYWFIDADFGICGGKHTGEPPKYKYEIGNYFETKEEAERAVEKLKAWKRVKDKGFEFEGGDDACISYKTDIENWSMQDLQDFKTLFGGEE